MGISPDLNHSQLILTIKREKDFVDMWFVQQDFNISYLKLQAEEVSDARWATFEEIDVMIKTVNFALQLSKA